MLAVWSPQVFLGDFGTAWQLVGEDGIPLQLGSRNELAERRAGVGRHKAPELRGRARADGHPADAGGLRQGRWVLGWRRDV